MYVCVWTTVIFEEKYFNYLGADWSNTTCHLLPFQRRKKPFISKYGMESDHFSDTLLVRYFDFLLKLSR